MKWPVSHGAYCSQSPARLGDLQAKPSRVSARLGSLPSLMADLDMLEKVMGTSPIQRWHEAHPDAVGIEHDVIRRMRREIEQLLHEVGVEKGK